MTTATVLNGLTPAERKAFPVGSGVLDYFPDALLVIAAVSKAGNDQHNPGQPLHWSRGKSDDHADTMIRHYLERGTMDTDGLPHSAKMAWRALAILQLECEARTAAESATLAGAPPPAPVYSTPEPTWERRGGDRREKTLSGFNNRTRFPDGRRKDDSSRSQFP